MEMNLYDKVKSAVEIELSERGMLSHDAVETVTHFAWNIAHQYGREILYKNDDCLTVFVRGFVQVWCKGFDEGQWMAGAGN